MAIAASTPIIPRTIKVCTMLIGAMPTSSKIGKPKKMAVVEPIIKSFAAGVSKFGSTSLSKITPVLAVPVSMPNMPRLAASL